MGPAAVGGVVLLLMIVIVLGIFVTIIRLLLAVQASLGPWLLHSDANLILKFFGFLLWIPLTMLWLAVMLFAFVGTLALLNDVRKWVRK